MIKRLFLRVEWCVYCVEKVLLVVSVLLMAGILIFDVMQRMGSHPIVQNAMFYVTPICGLAICYFGLSAREGRKGVIRLSFCALVFIGLMYSLNALFPTGFVGSQQLALGIMIWSAFLGASLAVRHRRHILLSALTAKVSAQMQPIFALTASVVTAIFCFYIAYLGALQAGFEIADWDPLKGTGEFEGLPIPLFIVTLALVVTPVLMGLRFLAQGAADHFGLRLIGDSSQN